MVGPDEKTSPKESDVKISPDRLAALERFEANQAGREKYNKARQASLQRLINAHKPEFDGYLAEEKVRLGA